MRRTSTRPVKTGTALAIMLAALGLGAAPALAATVGVSVPDRRLVLDGGPENDVLRITNPTGRTFVIDSAAPIGPTTAECTAVTPNQVSCTSPAIARLILNGNDGNDRITNDTGFASAINGGAGDDVLVGGSGADSITGGTGLDTVNGRGGNDDFFMQGTLVDTIICGDGTDFATADDGDVVTADCEQVTGRTAAGAADGTDSAPDGEPLQVFPEPVAGACDLSHTRTGTTGGDRLDGTSFGDVLIGLGGDDQLSGLGGADCLYGGAGNDRMLGGSGADFLKGEGGKDRMRGGAGADRLTGDRGSDVIAGGSKADLIVGGAGDDRVSGGSGRDTIGGGRGKDRVKGGSGQDRLFGGAGRDRLDSVDGRPDVVDCGRARDTARIDRIDQISNCEIVTRVSR